MQIVQSDPRFLVYCIKVTYSDLPLSTFGEKVLVQDIYWPCTIAAHRYLSHRGKQEPRRTTEDYAGKPAHVTEEY